MIRTSGMNAAEEEEAPGQEAAKKKDEAVSSSGAGTSSSSSSLPNSDISNEQQQQQQQQLLISVGEAMNPLRRSNMEDRFVVHREGTWGAPDPNMSYLAVYDGHGGRDIVDFLEHGLSYHMARELQHTATTTSSEEDDGDDVSLQTRIERAFLMADVHARQSGLLTSGSTVALCLVKSDFENNRVVVTTANVGDARIVLGAPSTATSIASPDHSKGGSRRASSSSRTAAVEAIRLTQDHNAHNPDEVTRIEQAGGFLFRNRVLGILAITRSVGDHMLKKYVIAHPYVQETVVQLKSPSNNPSINRSGKGENESSEVGGDDPSSSSDSATAPPPPFLIVACDGLWDVLSDQQAVNLVHGFRGERGDVAKFLVEEALRRGTTDNVTVIVAYLLNSKSR